MLKQNIKPDQHSAIAWYALGGIAASLEAYLFIVRKHTLSEHMRYWIQYSKFGSVLMMFWIWVMVHFIIEPVVRRIEALIRD